METFDKWFTRFMWGTDIVLLAASTPHIATWYQHFDNANDPISAFYSWLVGYGLAIAIDGVSLMLLYAMVRIIKHGTKSKGTVIGILVFMGFIMGLSWFINWQYDWVYGSTSFAKADNMTFTIIRTFTVGQLNPIIGGAFSVLMMAYAIIAKAVRSEEPIPEMTEEEFARQKRDITRKQELANLRKGNNETGLLAGAKERLIGKSKDTEELYHERLNAATDYMRNATDLLDRSQEQKAIELLAVFLKVNKKESSVYLEAVRPILLKEKEQASAPKEEENALPDKLRMTIDFLVQNGMDVPDESLAEFLGFSRVASALFWKSKARAMIQQNPSILQQKRERITGPLTPEFAGESGEEFGTNAQRNQEDFADETREPIAIPADMISLISLYPDAARLLDKSATTIAIVDVASIFGCRESTIIKRADSGKLSYVKGKGKVTKESVIDWAKVEMIGKGKRKVIDIESARNSEENEGEIQDEKVSG